MSQGLPPLNDYSANLTDEHINDVLEHIDEEDDDDVLNAYRDWKKNCAKASTRCRSNSCAI